MLILMFIYQTIPYLNQLWLKVYGENIDTTSICLKGWYNGTSCECYKLFEIFIFVVWFSDITSFQPDVHWVDQSRSLPSGLANWAYRYFLVNIPTRILEKLIFKLLVMTNHTHTWWHNVTPLENILISVSLNHLWISVLLSCNVGLHRSIIVPSH